MDRIVKNLKGYLYALVLFFALTWVVSLLIRFTPIPETWSIYYLIFLLCISCLFLGVYSGCHMKRRGFIYGALYSVIFLILIFAIFMLAFSSEIQSGFGLLKYLICIFFGSVGGMIGVNMKI